MKIGLIGTGRIGRFHAQTLLGARRGGQRGRHRREPSRPAQELAAATPNITVADSVENLLGAGIDGVAITAATRAPPKIHRSLDARVPVFCEKPVALDVPSTVEIVERVAGGDVPVEIGFQRRFDAGYRAANAALQSGGAGLAAQPARGHPADQTPPPAAFIPTSGGLFP